MGKPDKEFKGLIFKMVNDLKDDSDTVEWSKGVNPRPVFIYSNTVKKFSKVCDIKIKQKNCKDNLDKSNNKHFKCIR